MKIKEGDIISIDKSHIAKNARVLARVVSIFPEVDGIIVAICSWIKCETKPHLCDTVYDHDLVDLNKTHQYYIPDNELLKKLKLI